MITAGYAIIAVMCLVALYYSYKLMRQHLNAITVLIFIPLIFLWLDNFAIAAGKYVGEGPLLTGMTYLRFYWHWQMLPLLIIVAGALARRAGFAWAQPKWVMALFCILAVFFMIEDVPYIWKVTFQQTCYGDTIRYTINVAADQICAGTTPLPKQASPSPLPAISVNVILMIIGFMMWAKDKFPWLALACVFMFVCAASGAIPGFYWGQILGNLGEPIFNAGLIAAGFKYAGLPKPGAVTAPAPA
ncbi:MAG: hypothetical protein SFV19_19705 [Rhodospirillaceae bacterium]|nr:hypothetical protein [Rhodospirillaceae bacterium]